MIYINNKFVKKFKHNIKKLRLKLNMSQGELAHKSGLKLSNLAKLEGGFNINPTYNTLMSIANVLSKGSIDQIIQIKFKKRK